jgi:orotate phosphoribosyltransferase
VAADGVNPTPEDPVRLADRMADATTPQQQLVEIVKAKGLQHLPEPVQLASGGWSRDFVDGKLALAHYDDLEIACRAIVDGVRAAGIEFDAVGGLTMGADALAVGVAAVVRCRWFFVRKEPKGRGTGRQIEGARIGPGDRVLLVDDVITTGGSTLKAYDAVLAVGATVVAASALVDRGDVATRSFAERGVPFLPVATYADLGIEPVVPPEAS